VVCVSQKLCLYLIAKLLKRAHIYTLLWAPIHVDTPLICNAT